MDISERAGKYAEGKANEAITKAIEQAYIDGYRDGYKDCEEEIPVDFIEEDMEYIDLGLPSGTLWASDYERNEEGSVLYIPYADAVKRHLPTREQIEELQEECRWRYEYYFSNNNYHVGKAFCIGPNGNCLTFYYNGLYEAEKKAEPYLLFLWMKRDEDEDCNAFVIGNGGVFSGEGKCKDGRSGFRNIFTGFRLPIIQVR